MEDTNGLLQVIDYPPDGQARGTAEQLLATLAAGVVYTRYRGIEGSAVGMRLAFGPVDRFAEVWLKKSELGTVPFGRDVRLYRELPVPPDTRDLPPDKKGEYLLCVWWTPAPDELEDLNDWYREEHIPNLQSIPGWGRIRRFERVAGGGPAFLATHELFSLGVFRDPGYVPAVETPWRDRVTNNRLEYCRYVLQEAQ